MARLVYGLLLWAGLSGGQGWGQALAPGPVLQPLLPQLDPGDWVRVATQTNPLANEWVGPGEDAWMVVGKLVAFEGDALVVHSRRAALVLPLQAVSQVEVDRGRRGQRRKTLLGAAAGLVAGGALGVVMAGGPCGRGEALCGRGTGGAFLVGAGTVGVPLSGLGVLVSRFWTAKRSWEPAVWKDRSALDKP
ncbi:MAG: hypothetical protein GKR89_16460 [Candidatus Latescibacteria bacterium]|nr:hypothetical protein [Candidatus Latescibacterota bacterium]